MNELQKIDPQHDLSGKDLARPSELAPSIGGITPETMEQVIEFSKLMCQSKQGVPKPFRNEPGLCLAVTVQALQWGFNPFSLAQNSFVVNDKVAYEAKVITAAVNAHAPLRKPLSYTYDGEDADRTCSVSGVLRGDDEPRAYTTPKFKDITVKNSPLWKNDPDQQLAYYAARAWSRRYTPEVVLGVLSPDEAATIDGEAQEVNATGALKKALQEARQDEAAPEDEADQESGGASEDPSPHAPNGEDAPPEPVEDAADADDEAAQPEAEAASSADDEECDEEERGAAALAHTCIEQIEAAEDMAALKSHWTAIFNNEWHKFSDEEREALTAAKDARKAELDDGGAIHD